MIGSTLGAYRLDAELGSGGMGSVYAATARAAIAGLSIGDRVALKVVHPHLLESGDYAARFEREAQIGLAVDHPNVVRTLDWGAVEVDGTTHLFLAMEFVDGQTLDGLRDELQRVPEELCRHVGHEIAAGLSAIHAAGAVHRDLKPENVLITPQHEVKVMDLGVARLMDDAMRLSQTGMFVGSLQYAAPEQFRDGGKNVDGRVDLHALGLLLYELATGVNPFFADDFPGVLRHVLNTEPRRLGELEPQLSPFLEEVVVKLLAKEPADRFATADDVTDVLALGEQSAWWHDCAHAIRAATRQPLRRMRVTRETALHGRAAEVARLRELFGAASRSEGAVLLLDGEAGIGKSRLVDELIDVLHRDGEELSFLFGSYPPGGAATAAGAFASAFSEHVGDDGVGGLLTAAPVLVPAFDALLRAEPPPPGSPTLDREAIATCFVHALRSLAADRPTVLLIDDLHFAPEAGRALFAALAMAVPGHRVLLVGTTRPGLPSEWLGSVRTLPHVDQMSLSRLGPKDLIQMLEEAFGSLSLAQRLGAPIAVKCDGNPFFAFEIVRGLREAQFLSQADDGSWSTTRAIDDLAIPSTVLDLVNARVADLDEDERDLLDIAACCGFEFDPLVVGEVVGLRRIPLLKRLGQIERKHRLVRSVGLRFVFDHHQVQEALYGSLSELLRREYHAALGAVLAERIDSADDDAVRGRIAADACEHLFRGAAGSSALPHLARALDHLETSRAKARQAGLLESALAVPGLLNGPDRAGHLLRLAGGLSWLGRAEHAGDALEEALRLAREADDRELEAHVEGERAAHLKTVGLSTASREAAERVVAGDLVGADARATAKAHTVLSSLSMQEGRLEEAERHVVALLEIAETLEDNDLLSAAYGNRGTIYYHRSEFDQAVAAWERASMAAHAAGDRAREASLNGNMGAVAYSLGHFDEAMQRSEQFLRAAREIGDRIGEAKAAGNMGSIYRDLGRFDDAIAHHQIQRDRYREMGHRAGEGHACRTLANDFVHSGDLEHAIPLYRESIAIAVQTGDRIAEAAGSGDLAGALATVARLAESQVLRERQLAIAREIGDRDLEAVALVNLGVLLADLGDTRTGLERLRESCAIADDLGSQRVLGYGHDNTAELLWRSGDLDGAAAAVRAAIEVRRSIGYLTGLVQSLARLGGLRIERGHPDDAIAPLREAIDAGTPSTEHLAVLLALAEGRHDDATTALADLSEASPSLRRRLHWLCWLTTRDEAHAHAARAALDEELAALPEEHRAAAVIGHAERAAIRSRSA